MTTRGISMITPTGGRDDSFRRCVEYVHRFKKPLDVPVQWVVVNDVDELKQDQVRITIKGIDFTFVKPAHKWVSGVNTQAKNLLVACDHILYDRIIFIEDDDWYSPDHLINIYNELETADLVGEFTSCYYHIPSRSYKIMVNSNHASLCQTGMRSTHIDELRKICMHHVNFIDWSLWRVIQSKKLLTTYNCVGMKGLPGRPGIGIGHTPHIGQGWLKDDQLVTLRKWIGEDFHLYFE